VFTPALACGASVCGEFEIDSLSFIDVKLSGAIINRTNSLTSRESMDSKRFVI